MLPHSALLALGDKTEYNTILIEDFRTFCRTHQALLAPVFAAQQKMRTTAMGCSFWDNMSRRRIELRKGYNVPLSELMVLVSATLICVGCPALKCHDQSRAVYLTT